MSVEESQETKRVEEYMVSPIVLLTFYRPPFFQIVLVVAR